jgi:Hemerythrin HHE cation binding domain
VTVIERTTTTTTMTAGEFELATFDLYRDIHKGIRSELFGVTTEAGSIDPADRGAHVVLASRVERMVELLVSHAEHEDRAIQPVLEREYPAFAARIAYDHVTLETRMGDLTALAAAAVDVPNAARRLATHRLYLELASFTSAYLAHQDVEERTVMPALERAVGVDAVVATHEAIVGNIPPAEMAASLSLMLPAMNIDDRAELLGGLRANAPTAVFEGVWGLAASVLTADDHTALGVRLGIA